MAASPPRGHPVPDPPPPAHERLAAQSGVDRYAVMGNPVAHSLSPEIHAAFARATGQAVAYTAELVALDGFAVAVAAFFEAGGAGLNITLPFKQEAFRLCHRRSDRARVAGAVNTLWPGSDGQYHGDNTDGVGLVRDLAANHAIPLTAKRILVLGAGGAVHGILGPLLAGRPAQLVCANRTLSKALALCRDFQSLGAVEACDYSSLRGRAFDLVINGTSASLADELPPLPDGILQSGGACYDLAYGRAPTPFVAWAMRQHAALAFDGLGMLVEQAAESFFLWRGVRPATRPVICDLKARMGRS